MMYMKPFVENVEQIGKNGMETSEFCRYCGYPVEEYEQRVYLTSDVAHLRCHKKMESKHGIQLELFPKE